MTRLRRLMLGVAALALTAGAFAPGGLGAQGKALEDLLMDLNVTPLEAQPAPPLTVTTLEGDRLSLADMKGQVVLLYFMATW